MPPTVTPFRNLCTLIAALTTATLALADPPATAPTTAPAIATVLGGDALSSLSSIGGATFSPDGKTIAAAAVSGDGKILLWDAATGKPSGAIEGASGIAFLDFSPDGKTIYGCGFRGDLTAFDRKTGVATPLPGGNRLAMVAASPDGKTIALGGNEVRLIDSAGTELGALGSSGSRTTALAFTADGTRLLSAGLDKVVRLWDVKSQKNLLELNEKVSVADLSPDGKLIALGGTQNRLFDATTGKQAAALTFQGNGSSSANVHFSPDGKRLAVDLIQSSGIAIFDVATAKEISRIKTAKRGNTRFAWSPDSKRILIFGGLTKMRLFDVATGDPVFGQNAHRRPVISVAASPDGSTIATGDTEGHVVLWDVATGAPLPAKTADGDQSNTPFTGASSELTTAGGLQFAGDDELLVGSRTDITGWSIRAQKPTGRVPLENPQLTGVSASDDGAAYTVSANCLSVNVIDRKTNKKIAAVPMPEPIHSMEISRDGHRLYVAGERGIAVLDARSGNLLLDCEPPPAKPGPTVLSEDEHWLGTLTEQNVIVWDTQTGKIRATLPRGNGAFAFSGDEALIAINGPHGIDVFDIESGVPVVSLTAPQQEPQIYSLAFFAGGRRMVSGSGDSGVVLWDLLPAIPPGRVSEAQFPRLRLDHLWQDLDDPDNAIGYGAVAALVAMPDAATKLLGERMTDPSSAGKYRLTRAGAVLSWINTPPAKALRAKIIPAVVHPTTMPSTTPKR